MSLSSGHQLRTKPSLLVCGIHRKQSDVAAPVACFRVYATEEAARIVAQQNKLAPVEETANPGKIDAAAVHERPLGAKANIDEIANCFGISRGSRAGFRHDAIVGEDSTAVCAIGRIGRG